MFRHIFIAMPCALLLTSLSVAPTYAEQDIAATAIDAADNTNVSRTGR
jgi:hypothetical protein